MLCSEYPFLLMTAASFFKLPYRLIFAVATLNSLYIYDTESVQPIAIVAGLHYAAITDIAWYSWLQYSFSNAVSTPILFQKLINTLLLLKVGYRKISGFILPRWLLHSARI